MFRFNKQWTFLSVSIVSQLITSRATIGDLNIHIHKLTSNKTRNGFIIYPGNLSVSSPETSTIYENNLPVAYKPNLQSTHKWKYAFQITIFRKNVSQLDTGSFVNLQYLNYLDLQENNIEFLGRMPFQKLPSLNTLHLDDNSLECISRKVFVDLPVTCLTLSGNKLRYIEKNAIALPNLKILELQKNFLPYFKPGWFIFTSNLQMIDLSRNLIRKLRENAFSKFKLLQKIDLSNNKLRTIDKSSFKGLEDLKDLNLMSNQLTTLDSRTFKSSKSIETLDLSLNKLMSLPDELLEDLKTVKKFKVKYNPFKCRCYEKIRRWFHDNGKLLEGNICKYEESVPVCVVSKHTEGCLEIFDKAAIKIYREALVTVYKKLTYKSCPNLMFYFVKDKILTMLN